MIGFIYNILKDYLPKVFEFFNQYKSVKYLYTLDEINEKISKMDFLSFETTRWLNGQQLQALYADEMYEMRVFNGRDYLNIRIPYTQLVDFIQNPKSDIIIDGSLTNGSLTISKYFKMSDVLTDATEETLKEIIELKKPYDDCHPRIAGFRRAGKDKYNCTIELAKYFQHIRTNLNLDTRISYNGRMTTIRTLECEKSNNGLIDFSQSILANIIGVSAIWIMGNVNDYKVFLLPRKNNVGIYEGKLGIPSGYVEWPSDNKFKTTSLLEYLKLEIAREFAEETGIADSEIDLKQYAKVVDSTRIYYRTKLEIVPLAFMREMLRGGMPQMFFLIRTERIPNKILKNCFRNSLGTEEFDNSLFSKSTISSEVACNYLYAMKYLQSRQDGCIDVSYFK